MLRIVAVLCAFALTGCAMNSVQQANSEQLEQGRMPALFKTAMVMGLSYRFATDDVTSVRYSLPRQFLWGQATYVRVIGQGKFGDRKPLDACAALQFLGGRLHRAVLVNNYFGHCDNLTEDLTPDFLKYREDLIKRMNERKQQRACGVGPSTSCRANDG